MPYANNQGVRIYYEVEGQGPPLVLAHGGSDSLNMWRRCGHTDALKDDFQLILFDFRGHGRSDKPHEASAYGVKMADDVLAVLDDLGMTKAHYFGYSMGATTGFTLATRYAARFHSFILGGMTPYGWPEAMVKAVSVSIELFKLLLTDPEAYMLRMERLLGRSLTPEDRNEFLAKDTEAHVAVLTSLLDEPPLTDQDLAGILAPCLVFCGELDLFHRGAKESVDHMPQARFLSLPYLDHVTAFAQINLVLPRIKKFLAEVSKKQGT